MKSGHVVTELNRSLTNTTFEAQLPHFANTIWEGDGVIRAYYNPQKNTLGLRAPPPHRPALPSHPFLTADATHAQNTHTMPAQRNAAGLPIPPAAGAGPVQGAPPAPVQVPAPVQGVAPGHAAAAGLTD
jgi:hypothetical protein